MEEHHLWSWICVSSSWSPPLFITPERRFWHRLRGTGDWGRKKSAPLLQAPLPSQVMPGSKHLLTASHWLQGWRSYRGNRTVKKATKWRTPSRGASAGMTLISPQSTQGKCLCLILILKGVIWERSRWSSIMDAEELTVVLGQCLCCRSHSGVATLPRSRGCSPCCLSPSWLLCPVRLQLSTRTPAPWPLQMHLAGSHWWRPLPWLSKPWSSRKQPAGERSWEGERERKDGKDVQASSSYPLRKQRKRDADYTRKEGNVQRSSGQPFSVKAWSVNSLGFPGEAISVRTIQFCPCYPEASEHRCVPIKLYLPNPRWVLVHPSHSENCADTQAHGTAEQCKISSSGRTQTILLHNNPRA